MQQRTTSPSLPPHPATNHKPWHSRRSQRYEPSPTISNLPHHPLVHHHHHHHQFLPIVHPEIYPHPKTCHPSVAAPQESSDHRAIPHISNFATHPPHCPWQISSQWPVLPIDPAYPLKTARTNSSLLHIVYPGWHSIIRQGKDRIPLKMMHRICHDAMISFHVDLLAACFDSIVDHPPETFWLPYPAESPRNLNPLTKIPHRHQNPNHPPTPSAKFDIPDSICFQSDFAKVWKLPDRAACPWRLNSFHPIMARYVMYCSY
mmetsp:Transcript_86/g.130  ORF Transcript_86/g.130 Transcript_86/m.130 type:complete len:260 (+) Transcript_86:95-874(+)